MKPLLPILFLLFSALGAYAQEDPCPCDCPEEYEAQIYVPDECDFVKKGHMPVKLWTVQVARTFDPPKLEPGFFASQDPKDGTWRILYGLGTTNKDAAAASIEHIIENYPGFCNPWMLEVPPSSRMFGYRPDM